MSRVNELRRALEIIHNFGATPSPDPDWSVAVAAAVDRTRESPEHRDLVEGAIAILLGVEPGEALTIPRMVHRLAGGPSSVAGAPESKRGVVEEALGVLLGSSGIRPEDTPPRINWAEMAVHAVLSYCGDAVIPERAEEVEHAIGVLIGVGTEPLSIPDMIERMVGGGLAFGGVEASLISDAHYEFSGAELKTLLGEVAGATSGVFLREDPGKEMPSVEVAEALEAFLVASWPTFARAYSHPAVPE